MNGQVKGSAWIGYEGTEIWTEHAVHSLLTVRILENLMMGHQFLVTYSLCFDDYWEIENDSFPGPCPTNTIGHPTVLWLIAITLKLKHVYTQRHPFFGQI